jgi:hypothetical protein
MHVDAMKQIVTIYKKWRSDPIPDDVSQRLQQVFSKECLSGPGGEAKKTSRPRKARPKKKRS